jgi:hypothetical protein
MDTKKKKVGRPMKFESVSELQEKIDAYFDRCDAAEEPYLITGLALSLDTSRETLCDYGKKDKFSDTIKRAKLRVEADYEKSLRKNGRAGDIFGLKNFGWKDRTETAHSGGVAITTIKRVIVDPDG